jgi:predicted GNAT family acetyltransferase
VSADRQALEVRDDHGASRLILEVDGVVAWLEYRVDRGRLVLEHTEVPRALSGRGIGSRLVEAGVEKARTEGLRLRSECPFATAWLRRHPEALQASER